ncbi:MAG: hypothetical protein OHK0019_19340 [Saprospiraceae bacterium]
MPLLLELGGIGPFRFVFRAHEKNAIKYCLQNVKVNPKIVLLGNNFATFVSLYHGQTRFPMPDIQKKIRAIRGLRRLTQAKIAELAHVHPKTYQRIEAGTSPVTHALLETLAEIFHCTADDIVRFVLEQGQFESKVAISPEIEQLKSENFSLKAENDYL